MEETNRHIPCFLQIQRYFFWCIFVADEINLMKDQSTSWLQFGFYTVHYLLDVCIRNESSQFCESMSISRKKGTNRHIPCFLQILMTQCDIAASIWNTLFAACLTYIPAMEAANSGRVGHSAGFVLLGVRQKFASSAGFDRRRTCRYLRCTACYVRNDGYTKSQLMATKSSNM